jgi:hypothetical protein
MKTHTHTHTPGPWHYAPGELVYGPLGETVASCRFVTNFKDTNVANMRLVASAPELLAVLKSLVFETSHFLHGDGKNGASVANELRNAISALSKAEGVK